MITECSRASSFPFVPLRSSSFRFRSVFGAPLNHLSGAKLTLPGVQQVPGLVALLVPMAVPSLVTYGSLVTRFLKRSHRCHAARKVWGEPRRLLAGPLTKKEHRDAHVEALHYQVRGRERSRATWRESWSLPVTTLVALLLPSKRKTPLHHFPPLALSPPLPPPSLSLPRRSSPPRPAASWASGRLTQHLSERSLYWASTPPSTPPPTAPGTPRRSRRSTGRRSALSRGRTSWGRERGRARSGGGCREQ